jgi:TolB-like protein
LESLPVKRLTWIVLVTLLLSGLCAPVVASPTLDHWMQQTLLPYLSKRLSRYPRFKNQPFEVVAFENGMIVGRMNGLTARIRQQIINRLQSVSGADLVIPRPIRMQTWSERRSLDAVNCPAEQQVKIMVTVSVSRAGPSGRVRVMVRAIDMAEHRWVRHFKQVWSGAPTKQERALLGERVVDHSLLGTRGLPFGATQSALLANDLIPVVACLLKRIPPAPAIYIAPLPGNAKPYFKKTVALLGHNLSSFPHTHIAAYRKPNDTVLVLKTLQIAPNLVQVWVKLERHSKQAAVTSLNHPMYVHPGRQTSARASKAKRPAAFPGRASTKLIGAFRLVTPPRATLCDTPAAWGQGAVTLHSDTHLPSGGCFAIVYQAQRAARLYLLSQTNDGQLTRLLPNSCNALGLGLSGATVAQGKTLHVPLFGDGAPGYFRLDRHAGIERVYIIAVAGMSLPVKLSRYIRDAAGLCSVRTLQESPRPHELEATLKHVAAKNPRHFAWRVQQFHHDGDWPNAPY